MRWCQLRLLAYMAWPLFWALAITRRNRRRHICDKSNSIARRRRWYAAAKKRRRLQALNVRVAAARAQQAQLAAAMKKAAQAAALAVLPGDPVKAEMTYMPCATCHGMQAEGKRVFNAPGLAGQELWYVRSQHLKFKEGVRGQHPHDIYGMHLAMAASLIYNVEVLDKVVVCIASLITEKTVERSKRDAAAGKQHYASVQLAMVSMLRASKHDKLQRLTINTPGI